MKSLKDYADDPGICEYLETLIFRQQLLDYFETLRREAHHLYALLMQAPPSVVWIDWANSHAPWQSESYSVAAFCAAPEEAFPFPEELYLFVAGYIPRSERDQASELKYEPFSGRCVRLFSKRDELTVEALLNDFPAMLLLQSREALLDGHPLLPDDATAHRYGFTQDDLACLSVPMAHCYRLLTQELSEQYDALHAIRGYLGR